MTYFEQLLQTSTALLAADMASCPGWRLEWDVRREMITSAVKTAAVLIEKCKEEVTK